MSNLTAFERRRRRMKVHQRDQVRFAEEGCPQLTELIEQLSARFIAEACAVDEIAGDFIEWYTDEWIRYGTPLKPGIAALYWRWVEADERGVWRLSRDVHDGGRDALAAEIETQMLDGWPQSGRTIIQEFFWWSAGDWLPQQHVVVAINEFREFARQSGKMTHWRKKKFRRLAAARRKALKSQLAVLLDDLDAARPSIDYEPGKPDDPALN